jgi:hypothetical protein
MVPFQRLVRFLDASGNVYYGEAGESVGPEDLVGKLVPIFEGASPWDLSFPKTTMYREVTKVKSHLLIFLLSGIRSFADLVLGSLSPRDHPGNLLCWVKLSTPY